MKTNNLMKLLFAVSLLLPAEVLAQETSGVEAFKQNRDAKGNYPKNARYHTG